jgi:phage gp45-like
VSLRQTLAEAAQRAFNGIARGTLVKADDAHKWQEVRVRTEFGDDWSNVEVAHPYGVTSVAKPPADSKTSDAAECVIVFPDGDRSHPIVIVMGDRRYRLQNLQEGEFAIHDDQGQQVYISRDRIVVNSSKEIHVQSGDAHGLFTSDKTKLQYDNMSVTLKTDKVLLGAEQKATHAVMTADGASSKVFAVLAEVEDTMGAATIGQTG